MIMMMMATGAPALLYGSLASERCPDTCDCWDSHSRGYWTDKISTFKSKLKSKFKRTRKDTTQPQPSLLEPPEIWWSQGRCREFIYIILTEQCRMDRSAAEQAAERFYGEGDEMLGRDMAWWIKSYGKEKGIEIWRAIHFENVSAALKGSMEGRN